VGVLEDIAAQRQRLAERLARIDAERAKLGEQLAELEAAERVLSRFAVNETEGRRRGRRRREAQATSTETPPARGGGRARSASITAASGRRRGRGRSGERARTKPSVPLADAVLRAVEALGYAVATDQIREYLARELQMQVRPNHLGRALQSHRRAGRLEEEDGRWSIRQAEGEPATD